MPGDLPDHIPLIDVEEEYYEGWNDCLKAFLGELPQEVKPQEEGNDNDKFRKI